MASSSIQSSSSALMTMTTKYDVFVSFRGEDTRHTFTGHLFDALQRNGIFAFRDDTKLKKGESIAPGLLCAIEGSQIFVVVLSKDYASSTWCLLELEKILECVCVPGKRVLPIFHDVDPSEVRHQRGSYAEAFAKHEEKFKQHPEMVLRWRAALTKVASFSGWDLRNKSESEEIKKIVKEILDILRHQVSCLPNDDLVGIHSPLEELEKLLRLGSVNDVRVVGISGMDGIGKTTLATALYSRISHQFDACCFIDDVSKIYRDDGPIGAQKKILHQTQGEEHLQIHNLYDGANLMRSRLRHLQSLIILDNVDKVEQLEKLVMNRKWLGAGSRVIIISRDEHVLNVYGVDGVYKVPLLSWIDSFQLFSREAFKRDNIMSDYEQLAYDLLCYADGLPLAIKILGSFLFGRDFPQWRSALARLRETPNKDIMDVLRLSFDGLEQDEKEIFLDIACFFNGKEETYVKNILDCCGYQPDIGLRILFEQSLISYYHDIFNRSYIQMHGLLQELGRKIVQENSTKEPRKWSRLWLHKHFYNVMSENMEKNVKAIVLDKNQRETEAMVAEDLSRMSHLRLLILPYNVISLGSLTCLSNELRYVKWHKCPFRYLPFSFQPNELVELILQHSNIEQLWEGKKYLPCLRIMDLRHSKNLIKMPDFRDVPNLKRLDLKGCVKLVEIDSSIGALSKLVFLNLKNCKNLRSIPNNVFGLSSLKDLNLCGCSKVFNNQSLLLLLQSMSSSIRRMFKRTIVLPPQSLHRSAHKDLSTASSLLPSLPSLSNFSCLCELDISFCGLSQIPNVVIGCMLWLERLNLAGNNFVTLPSLKELSKLVYLDLQHCKHLKSLPELPSPPAIDCKDRHMFSNTNFRWREPGLYIFNCLELGERERCYAETSSWIIQFIRASQAFSASFNKIDIVTPGNEIPSWFNNQNSGGSISMGDLSYIMHYNNVIGLAYCLVFSVASCYLIEENRRTKIALRFASGPLNTICFPTPVELHKDLIITDKSDHVLIMYFNRESFFPRLRFYGEPRVTMEVSPDYILDFPVKYKKCGYRWVFKQDLCGNLPIWSKYLAIEDKAQPQP